MNIDNSLQKLNNTLSRKRVEYFEISDKCNSNGEIKMKLSSKIQFDPNYDYKVSLISGESTSFFPNLDDKNNKFYYSVVDTEIKEIKLDTGAYEIKSYYEHLINHIDNFNTSDPLFKISLDKSTGKTIIKLKQGVKIYFDKDDTWRDRLGFKSTVLDQKINISDKICDVWPFQHIYLTCDIIEGAYFNQVPSKILYAFPNSAEFGEPIILNPKNKRECNLLDKSFQQITFRFHNEHNQPVTFGGALVNLTLEIRQV